MSIECQPRCQCPECQSRVSFNASLHMLNNFHVPFGMFCRREISSAENGDDDWSVLLVGKINFMMFRVLTSCANLLWAAAVSPADKVLSQDKQDRSSATLVVSLWSSWRRKIKHIEEIKQQKSTAINRKTLETSQKSSWTEKHYIGHSNDKLNS